MNFREYNSLLQGDETLKIEEYKIAATVFWQTMTKIFCRFSFPKYQCPFTFCVV